MTKLRITALGSSFAAGPRIEPTENEAAGRSSRNYAHQLAEKLKADLTDLTVSGATLSNVLNKSQTILGQTFAPQLQGMPPETDIVTLTCGGNDMDYIGSILTDSHMTLEQPDKGWTPSQATAPLLEVPELIDRFLAVLYKIQSIAPKAQVYLVGYLSLIGDGTRSGTDIPLTADQISHYKRVAQLLRQAYIDAAKACPWAELVDVAEMSSGHALGSKEPWVLGCDRDMIRYGHLTYHPNLAGHTAVADMIYRQVVGGQGHKERL